MNTTAPDRVPARQADEGPVLQVTFARPRDSRALEWLQGTTPNEAIERIGLAYSICRHAQQAAAQLAVKAAEDETQGTNDPLLAQRIHGEWLREHACNLMLSWPRLLGQREEPALPRALMQAGTEAAAARNTLAEHLRRDVLGIRADAFLAMDASALRAWCADAGTATAARFRAWQHQNNEGSQTPSMLPPLREWDRATATMMASHMREDPDFCLLPHWHGRSVEIGAHARQRAHPLLQAWAADNPAARMLARLIELAMVASGQDHDTVQCAWSLGAGEGIAAVETARGPLLHRARLHHGRIEAYQVLAPTEWNFHPHGPLTQALRVRDRDRREAAIEAWILALDPCDTCQVEVLHA